MIPPFSDLEARAHWHLEIGYPPYPHPVEQEEPEYDEYEGYEGRSTCWACGGEGIEITCCDDICHGIGYCMHGDGQRMCPECHGEGVL